MHRSTRSQSRKQADAQFVLEGVRSDAKRRADPIGLVVCNDYPIPVSPAIAFYNPGQMRWRGRKLPSDGVVEYRSRDKRRYTRMISRI
jgi:hypothetical protein